MTPREETLAEYFERTKWRNRRSLEKLGHPASAFESRIGVISDIHGNVGALEKVFEAAGKEGLSRFWCLGDAIDWLLPREPSLRGNPEALRRVLERCEHVLLGNHEVELLGDEQGRPVIACEPDGAELLSALADLPSRRDLELGGIAVELVHGSPADPAWGVIETAEDVRQAFAASSARLILCGHTHHPMIAVLDDATGEVNFPKCTQDWHKLRLDRQRVIVNPGAVGGGAGVAIWTVLELDDRRAPAAIAFRITPSRPPRLFSH